jgi:hypothetical protein
VAPPLRRVEADHLGVQPHCLPPPLHLSLSPSLPPRLLVLRFRPEEGDGRGAKAGREQGGGDRATKRYGGRAERRFSQGVTPGRRLSLLVMRFATKGAPQLVRHHTSISRGRWLREADMTRLSLSTHVKTPRSSSRSRRPARASTVYARTPHCCGDCRDPARSAGAGTQRWWCGSATARRRGDGGEGDTSDHAMQRRPCRALLCYCYGYAISVACLPVWWVV